MMNNFFDILLNAEIIEQHQNHFTHASNKQPACSLLHHLSKTSHKGNFAHVAVLEGSPNTYGASRLAALASLRAGASLVTLLVEDFNNRPGDIPEFMKRKASELRVDDFQRFDAAIIGPGLGVDPSLQNRATKVAQYVSQHGIPIIVDADGLFLLKNPPMDMDNRSCIIATPHPGEAAKLLDCTSAEIESNRMYAAQELTKLAINNIVRTIFVLKGACPIIIQKGYLPIECEGNVSALSIGGSGDVLSGVIAALTKQTSDPLIATLVGVGAHLQAGRLLEMQCLRGSLASEIANAVSKVLYPSP